MALPQDLDLASPRCIYPLEEVRFEAHGPTGIRMFRWCVCVHRGVGCIDACLRWSCWPHSHSPSTPAHPRPALCSSLSSVMVVATCNRLGCTLRPEGTLCCSHTPPHPTSRFAGLAQVVGAQGRHQLHTQPLAACLATRGIAGGSATCKECHLVTHSPSRLSCAGGGQVPAGGAAEEICVALCFQPQPGQWWRCIATLG